MQFNTVNPVPLLTGIEMNVGPNGEQTKLEAVSSGFNLKTIGKTEIDSKVSVNLKTVGTFTNDAKTSLTNKTALGQLSIEESGKLKFESNKVTLGTVLAELMVALKGLTVPTGTGPSGQPINLPAFTAVENKLKQMLS